MDQKIRLAVIDDEPIVCQRLKQIFKKGSYEVETFGEGRTALQRMAEKNFQLILSDIRLPDMDGLEILKRIKKEYPGTEVILITGYATLDQAVEAVKKGAFYYLAKPFSPNQVLAIVGRAVDHLMLSHENQQLRKELRQKYSFESIIGISSQSRS